MKIFKDFDGNNEEDVPAKLANYCIRQVKRNVPIAKYEIDVFEPEYDADATYYVIVDKRKTSKRKAFNVLMREIASDYDVTLDEPKEKLYKKFKAF